MVSAFLTGRNMKIKIGKSFSTSRPMNGGAPQGTKMGNFLFSVTIYEIEDHDQLLQAIPPAVAPVGHEREDEDELGLRRMARALSVGPIKMMNSRVIASTPHKHHTRDGILRYHDVSGGRSNRAEDSRIARRALDAANEI